MRKSEIDYQAVFNALPGAILLLTPELIIVDANTAYRQVSGRGRDELLGRRLFDVFPDNPDDPSATGMRNLSASLQRVLETGERDSMALQRYDVEVPGRPGVFEKRYWSPVNSPVLDPDGGVALIAHRVLEVTEFIRRRGGPEGEEDRLQVMEAELYSRAKEIQRTNEQLREAHARERQVALALQEAMLPAPLPVWDRKSAVRYQPATDTLNVCGDWYEVVFLADDLLAVAVGDVVGHGLSAAGVMGQLRSALSAAVRVTDGPARALQVLDRYARSVWGAEATTAVQTLVDWSARTVTYSSSGHPPPVLLHANGPVEFLDRATDPPLGVRPEPADQPQASTPFEPGSTLVLYTDGLVERRGEDIDTGLERLADSLSRHRGLDTDALADALLAELVPPEGSTDDTALIILAL